MTSSQTSTDGTPRTVAEALGQVTWLFTQSPLHKHLPIGDLEWSVMPAILHEQFRVFRFGHLEALDGVAAEDYLQGLTRQGLEQMPLGVAFWGLLSEAAEAKVQVGQRLTMEDWKSGDRLWLLELISPFTTPDNKLTEAMFADMLTGPFRGKAFSLHRNDPETGARVKITLGG